MLCYQSAYLKVNYPLEWMANSLTNAYMRKEEIEETVSECRRLGIRFSSLDYNKSLWNFSVDKDLENSINIGLCAIKFFSENAANALIEARPFTDFEDLINRIPKSSFSKRAFVPAIFSGLFNSIDLNRKSMYNLYCEIRKEEPLAEIKILKDSISTDASLMDMESFFLESPLTSSPVNDFERINYEEKEPGSKVILNAVVSKVNKFRDKSNNMMCFLDLDTADGAISSVMFASVYKNKKALCKKNAVLKLTGKKNEDQSFIISDAEEITLC